MTGSAADPGLWPFALALYGAPGVADACLTVQETAAADVPMLLWAAWRGTAGHRLQPQDCARAQAAVTEWHTQVVRPLRAVRQRMKSGPAPAPSPGTEALRDRLKAVEIGAERIELEVLEALPAPGEADAPPEQAIADNLAALMGPQPAPVAEALALIARTAAALPVPRAPE